MMRILVAGEAAASAAAAQVVRHLLWPPFRPMKKSHLAQFVISLQSSVQLAGFDSKTYFRRLENAANI